MSAIVSCIPNFSEGSRTEVVEEIVDAMSAAAKVQIVDWSMDADHNRSVVTFIGQPDRVRKSILAGARVAIRQIDMNHHKGGHPRIGAVDVVPVVPVMDIDMDGAIALGHQIGRDFAEDLGVPVYFYEECALRDHCVNLAHTRRGGFEALKHLGLTGDRAPDLGPAQVHPTAGASVVGARGPLIAYNINLATSDMHIAKAIAAKIRRVRDHHGRLPGVKAIAVYLKSRDIAQVSTNITRPDLIGMHEVYAFVESEAKALGVDILESELIGALRTDAVFDAARSALKFSALPENRTLDYWIRQL